MWFSRSKKEDRNSTYARPRWVRAPQQRTGGRTADLDLDMNHLARRGFITPAMLETDLAHEFSLIKRRLFRRLGYFDRNPSAVSEAKHGGSNKANGRRGWHERCPLALFSSGSPGEGKTFSASNLALSLALAEQIDVLLIDADLAKPSIPETFGFAEDLPGLFDCLSDPTRNVEDLIQHAGNARLSILPAGQATSSPTPLLGSEAMLMVLDAVSYGPEAYDFVVMDGPPLLATTEAAVLAPYADEVVLVVGAGEATVTQINAALELLGDHDKVSLMINLMPFSDRLPSDYSGPDRLSA